MATTSTLPHSLRWPLLIGAALLVLLYLYFIDEGHYSLAGLFGGEALFVLGLYLIGLLGGLFLMNKRFANRRPEPARTLWTLLLGIPLGLVLGLILVLLAGLGLLLLGA